jgi:hypothetical protein
VKSRKRGSMSPGAQMHCKKKVKEMLPLPILLEIELSVSGPTSEKTVSV